MGPISHQHVGEANMLVPLAVGFRVLSVGEMLARCWRDVDHSYGTGTVKSYVFYMH